MEMLDLRTWVLGEPKVVSNSSVQPLQYQTTAALALPREFLPNKTQVLQPRFVQHFTEVPHLVFASQPKVALLMGPEDFIEIPCAEPRQCGTCTKLTEESPSIPLFGWIGEPVNPRKTPPFIRRSPNHNVNMIRRRGDYLDRCCVFPIKN